MLAALGRGCVETPAENFLVEYHSIKQPYMKHRTLERTKRTR